jgi:hypothetical protein
VWQSSSIPDHNSHILSALNKGTEKYQNKLSSGSWTEACNTQHVAGKKGGNMLGAAPLLEEDLDDNHSIGTDDDHNDANQSKTTWPKRNSWRLSHCIWILTRNQASL